ncbi:hypothetical protein WMY93_008094 [Mugilogobius chulae]|uniref:Protein FAM111A n=1 Tax=Mugilogobius chulae TaxID=88201 RepID=A0AAW0PTK5_9GOBI
MFKVTCALSHFTTDVEMSNLVDDLGGKTFRVIMLNKNSPPESQPSSLEDALYEQGHDDDSVEQRIDEGGCVKQEDDEDHTIEQGNCNDTNKPSLDELHEIPDSREMRSHLSSLVRDFIEKKSTDLNIDKGNLLSVEYGRTQGAQTVKIMKRLMSLSDSVCQVRIKDSAVGTGFILFSSFVLTNFHVIKDVFNYNNYQLMETVSVHFSFESLDQAAEGHQVKEVVAAEYYTDVSGQKCDWALLALNSDQEFPSGLLEHFGFLPQSTSICIIGHPYGGVKKIDQSWIIPSKSHSQVIEKHYNENRTYSGTGEVIEFVASSFAEGIAKELYNSRDLTYDTCFFFGSSGSPVFDSHGNVVAMHSGGFVYESPSGGKQSVIEYGHPLSSILENLIIQLVIRRRLEVLKKYLLSFYKRHEAILHNVKKLIASHNLTVFQCTLNDEKVLNDDTLRLFFEFVCAPDTPVSMDIGCTHRNI